MTEVKCSYKPSVSCVELLRSGGINILVVVSDIPLFWLDYKPPTTKNIELATEGKPERWNAWVEEKYRKLGILTLKKGYFIIKQTNWLKRENFFGVLTRNDIFKRENMYLYSSNDT